MKILQRTQTRYVTRLHIRLALQQPVSLHMSATVG